MIAGLHASEAERFRAKWLPVRVKKTRENKSLPFRGTESGLIRDFYGGLHRQRAAADADFADGVGNPDALPLEGVP